MSNQLISYNKSPAVSVIVTAYNSEQHLDACLNSLQSQDLDDLEVIIVIDGPEGSFDLPVSQSYRNKDKRFKVLDLKRNVGIGRAREIAIKSATGNYVGFLDSDALISEKAFSVMYKEATDANADIAVADYWIDREIKKEDFLDSKVSFYDVENLSGEQLFEYQLKHVHRPYYLRGDWWNKIYKKELFLKNEITLPRVVSDEGTMSMIMSLVSNNCVIINEKLFCTSTRPESVCRNFGKENIDDTIISTLHFQEWLYKTGCYEKYQDAFIKFFYYIVFNHNLSLILKQPKQAREEHLEHLSMKLYSNRNIRCGLLQYLNWDPLSAERLAFASLNNRRTYSALAVIKKTPFLMRSEGGLRLRERQSWSQREDKVTVVTITRNLVKNNRLEYFRRLIDSLNSQSFGRKNIEHIVIDGLSDDGTCDYYRELDKKGSIDYWVSEPDNGIYNAMNKGPLFASGGYLMFVNSDDFLAQTAIADLVSAIKANNAHYAFADALKIDESENIKGAHVGDMDKVFYGSPYCHQTLLCRKQCFQDVFFDESYQITMWPYALSLYLAGYKFVYLPKALAYFRIGGLSTHSDNKENLVAEQNRVKNDLIVKRLGITLHEYEYLNHRIRRWSCENFAGINENRLFQKIERTDSEFGRSFLAATKRLLNLALPDYLQTSAGSASQPPPGASCPQGHHTGATPWHRIRSRFRRG